jgi:glycosyltransferase involved in cell wall biosynthesis
LFLTWDGPQQSYLESLFFPIFAGLRRRGIDVGVLQVTWARASQLSAVERAAERFGVRYRSCHVPEALRKAALPALLAYGSLTARLQLERERTRVIFPRSLLPMSMTLLGGLATGRVLLFDADGFMADERLDFGGWRADSPAYRVLRRVEAAGVRRAHAVICRTEQARVILGERSGLGHDGAGKIFVAPNAKDANEFTVMSEPDRAVVRERNGIPRDAPWVVYVGSVGPQYCPELMLDCFAAIRQSRPDTRFSCFTFHAAQLKPLLDARGLTAAVEVSSLEPSQVRNVLAAADLGIALRRDVPSQRGVCPIKVAEYLLCGLPVVTSPVGDLEAQLSGSAAAQLVDARNATAARSVGDWFAGEVLARREQLRVEARELGIRWFELSRCVETYAGAFQRATGNQA